MRHSPPTSPKAARPLQPELVPAPPPPAKRAAQPTAPDTPRAASASPPATRLIDIPQACELLGIRRSSLFELLRTGKLAAVKLGRRTLVRLDAIHAFIEGLQRASYSAPPKTSRRKGARR